MTAVVDSSARLQIPDASLAGPSQSSRQGGSTRPASAQVYPSSTSHSAPSSNGPQHARKRASHTVTSSSQPQQDEQTVGYRDVYSHPAAQAYAAQHPRRTIPKFGPYLLLQTLGEGEFGKVKLGLHCQWGEEVAVKLIRRGNIDTAVRMSKVEREIEVLRTLKHPNIVRLYDVIETDKYIGIILEYASGGELFDHILAHRYLKEKDACKLFSQLISGVWYIHEKKIVHRDLKLENLLLDRHRNVIITDFGFANRFEHKADDLMQTSCGSPCYAAPELVISEGLYVGSAVDIWSCGVILYAMLAGYLPFDDDPANPDGDNINLLYRYIVNTPLTFPDYVSTEARDLLSMMLVPDPSKRADMAAIMKHEWLKPYAHLFERSVERLETLAMEQHQVKRLAYQRQMRQQAAAAAEQSRMQRSQSARVDPSIGSGSRSRNHPPMAMNQEFLYESQADEPLFTTAAPAVPPTSRRNAASAVVIPSMNNHQIVDDDPFAPSPTVPGNTPSYVKASSPSKDGEPRARRSRESTNSKTPRKAAAAPVGTAPVNMSPERERRKADRQRHTIQLEYGGGDGQDDVPRTHRSSRSKHQPPEADIMDNGVFIGDVVNPGAMPSSAGAVDYVHPSQSKNSVKIDRSGSMSRGMKPLPTPPSAGPISSGSGSGPRRSSSVPGVGVVPDIAQDAPVPDEQQTPKLPTVNVAPASPPRMENMPPSAYDQERVNQAKGNSGSIGSTASSKHRRGISMDKLVGKLWNNGTPIPDADGVIQTNGIGTGTPADAQGSLGPIQRSASQKTPSPRPSTLQVSNSSQQSTESKAETDKSSDVKKSRRNTLTVMVEPLAKLSRQRTKGKTTPNEAVPKKEPSLVIQPATTLNTDYVAPQVPKFPTPAQPVAGHAASVPNIPASTSKASKVMQWFRHRSKRTASSGPPPEEFVDTPVQGELEDRSATPTGGHIEVVAASSTETVNQTPQVVVSTPVERTRPPQLRAPAMAGRTTATEPSPSTSHGNRVYNVLSNFVTSPGATSKGGFNKTAMRVHHGAVDQTTVTTGSPPDVMKHVTKVLLDMGLELDRESEYKYRCVRPKKRKVNGTASGTGLAAFTMTGSAASNGVDKRGLPIPSQSSFGSTGGILKGLLMRRQSSQVSSSGGSLNHPTSYDTDSSVDPHTITNGSREKLAAMQAHPGHEAVYGDRMNDQGDEVRFYVELTRIDGLDGTYSLDIRRLKGHLRSYKFLYDTLRERCNLQR